MANTTDDGSALVYGWRSGPPHDERGTYDIISLCATTLIICAWNAVHVDVPRRRTFWRTHGARAAWFLVGVFVPEVLLTFAIGQFLKARQLTAYAQRRLPAGQASAVVGSFSDPAATKAYEAIEDDEDGERAPGKDVRVNEWTLTHSFFALMGGFPDINPDRLRFGQLDLIVNAPDVPRADLMDRSKDGAMSKALLCAQIVFFCASCGARFTQKLPLSLLEITTIAHSLCALVAYFVWWHKPQNIGSEAPLRDEAPAARNFLGLIYATYSADLTKYGKSSRSPQFPTQSEHNVWVFATLVVIICPIVWTVGLYFYAIADEQYKWVAGVFIVIFALPYVPASSFLIGESVRELFALPEAAFLEPQWTLYIPHIS